MGYIEEVAEREKQTRDQQEAARQSEMIYNFLVRNRSVINNQANLSILKAFFGGTFVGVSLQQLEDAFNNTSVFGQLALQNEEQERNRLTKVILKNRVMSPETSESEHDRFMNKNLTAIETVRKVADNVVNRRAIEAEELTDRQLRELARGPQQTCPVLPKRLQNRRIILGLSPDALKFAMRRYGRTQIDYILSQEQIDEI